MKFHVSQTFRCSSVLVVVSYLELYIKCLSLLFLDSGWLSELADTVGDSTDVQMSNVQMVSTQAHKVRQDGDERM